MVIYNLYNSSNVRFMKNKMREIRLSKDMTLEQVASKANTSAQQIQKLELNERKLDIFWMPRIAKALGVSAYDLVDFEEKDRPVGATTLEKIAQELRELKDAVNGVLAKEHSDLLRKNNNNTKSNSN